MLHPMDGKTDTGFGELAAALARECEGLPLIDADSALDDARRFLWLRQFSGASTKALLEQLTSEHLETGLRIADLLDGKVSPMEAENVFTEARAALWMSTFANIPDSLFAHQLRAHAERHEPGAKLH